MANLKNTPKLTVIAVAYQRYLNIPILIHSFLTQSSSDWELLIVHDGYDKTHESIVMPYVDQFENIHYRYSKQRYNDYGHTLREQYLYEFPVKDWVLQTNDDNYYVPNFWKNVSQVIQEDSSVDLVYWDAVQNIRLKTNTHNHDFFGVQQSDLRMRKFDMGSFVIQSKLFQEIGFSSRSFEADGIFIESLVTEYPNTTVAKLNQCLFFHN